MMISNPVNIILFFNLENKGCPDLVESVGEIIPAEFMESIHDIQSLSCGLRKPNHDISVIILMASDKDELTELIRLRNLMNDIPIILILPDKEKDTVSKGHKLYPRFITYVKQDIG